MKKVTIIVPVYKVEKYLKQCLDSIVNQTYSNLEILLVEDGSPDFCGEICDTYAKQDERIKVIHQENAGLSEARNVGLRYATGEYLLFVDSDDWLEHELCEMAVKDLEAHEADVVVFGYYEVSDAGQIQGVQFSHCSETFSGVEGIKKLLIYEIENYAWNKLYKRDVFRDITYPKGRLFEDIGTTYKVFGNAIKIVQTNRVLYFYRQREGSISKQVSLRNQMEYIDMYLERYEVVCKEWPVLKKVTIEKAIPFMIWEYAYLHDKAFRTHNEQVEQYKHKLVQYIEKLVADESSREIINQDWYVRFFMKYKWLFEVYCRLGFHRWTKIHTLFRMLISSSLFVKKENLELPAFNGKRHCFLIGTPDHDNLGDHAIGMAEIQYLKKCMPDYDIVVISEERYYRVRKDLKKKCSESDVIILHGGGNLGNEYPWCERIREDVLKRFPKQRVMLFPQTVYFTNTFFGNIMKKKARQIYKKSKVILLAREKASFEEMKQLFPYNQSYLVPDIVLLLDVMKVNEKRQGALLCLRLDKEAVLTWEQRRKLYEHCKKMLQDVRYTDTTSRKRHDEVTGSVAVEKKLEQFAQSRIVITDRLHGMVFAALTKTPCVVLSNYNAKVQGVYQWIAKLNYIEFLENIKDLESVVKRLLDLKQTDEYPRKWMQEQYKAIEQQLEEWNKL